MSVKNVLIIVCSAFAILMNSCFVDRDPCAFAQMNACTDSTAANFNLSSTAKAWWLNDSIKTGTVVFVNDLGASLNFYKTSKNNQLKSTTFGTYQKLSKDECYDVYNCNVNIRYKSYNFTYNNSNYKFKIEINLDRRIPVNTSNLDSLNWQEHLVFTYNSNTSLRVQPGQQNVLFNKWELIPTININNKVYTDVTHVYDSTLMSSNSIVIVGYYFNPTNGLIRYYFNNNDVWSIQ